METTNRYWRRPTKEEIKFGHGAIHYRDFDRKLCTNTEGKLHLSIISQIDGLKYYSANHEYTSARYYKPVRVNDI